MQRDFFRGIQKREVCASFFPMKTRGYVEIPWDVETLGTFVRLHKEELIFFVPGCVFETE